MTSPKVMLQLLVFSLVFTMFTAHRALGEKECYHERDLVKHECIKTILINEPYKPPTPECVRAIKLSDIVCICHILTPADESEISVRKLLRLAGEYNRPVPPAGSKCGFKYLIVSMFLLLQKCLVQYRCEIWYEFFSLSSNRWTLTIYPSLPRADLWDFMIQKPKEE